MPATASKPDLSWLADSPIFIDSQQISAFYDAVVGPAFRTVEVHLSADQTGQLEKSVGTQVATGLSSLFPWLKLSAAVDAGRVTTSGRREGSSVIVQPAESAARQLVELSLHYLVNQPGRICMVDRVSPIPGSDAIATSPRMIAFVDAGPGTKFLPQAAELNDGRVVTFFDPMVEALKRDGGTLPVAYPDSISTDAGKLQRDSYWNWFADHWNADKAVKVVENVIGDGGRPRWIAYRTTLDTGMTLNLQVVGRGAYDTGVFAYDIIRRGQRYGLRIVGSLKSRPALNVLAIYDK